jgi:xylulose-5-phosphate/fructose-6-phosphate phosphoketolase
LSDQAFDEIFTASKPIIFAYHGYPWLIHRLCYRRHNHDNLHVRGYKEEGTTTTPFDMVVLNNMDRFQLAIDAIRRAQKLSDAAEPAIKLLEDKLAEHHDYIREHGEDMPEIRDWRWIEAGEFKIDNL